MYTRRPYPQILYGLLATGCLIVLLVTTSNESATTPGSNVTDASTTVAAPSFDEYPAGEARKQAFFKFFGPIIERENERVDALRDRLISIRNKAEPDATDLAFIRLTAYQHRVDLTDRETEQFWGELMRKVDIVPVSLALAQAANESAWGTSRFARVANNYFGQWCFSEGCGVVPEQRGASLTHEVKAFDHPVESVRSYIRNLNSHPAYSELREKRADLRSSNQPISGTELAEGLEKYSERGDDYVEEIQAMIRYNRLGRLDSA